MFLSYIPQEPLKDYLFNANIYKGRRNDDFTKEEANELLRNNNFARQELKGNNISTISPEAKARSKPLNN